MVLHKSAFHALKLANELGLSLSKSSRIRLGLTSFFSASRPYYSALEEIRIRVAMYELTREETLLDFLVEGQELIKKLDHSEFLAMKDVVLGTLRRLGNHREASSLSISLKTELDRRKDRVSGLYGESAHFSAMGHLALIHYLLLAAEARICDPSKVTLVRGEYPIANEPFAGWMERRARSVGIRVVNFNEFPDPTEPDLELWPQGEGYIDSHLHHGVALRHTMSMDRLLDPIIFEDIIQGRQFLASRDLDLEAPVVGFHIQNNQLRSRSLRNSSPKKYAEVMEKLVAEGYQAVVLGELASRDARALPRSVFRVADIRQDYEKARANLAVWHDCVFFVGNLSGGTNPAGVFGRPILWVDQYPLNQWRVAGPKDLFLPQLAFSLREKRFLSLSEHLGDAHSWSQTEDPGLLKRAGYALRPVSSADILHAVEEMKARTAEAHIALTSQQSQVDLIYRERGFLQGGNIPQTFLSEWGPVLLGKTESITD